MYLCICLVCWLTWAFCFAPSQLPYGATGAVPNALMDSCAPEALGSLPPESANSPRFSGFCYGPLVVGPCYSDSCGSVLWAPVRIWSMIGVYWGPDKGSILGPLGAGDLDWLLNAFRCMCRNGTIGMYHIERSLPSYLEAQGTS